MGDLRGVGPENVLHQKGGGDLKCFQNTGKFHSCFIGF